MSKLDLFVVKVISFLFISFVSLLFLTGNTHIFAVEVGCNHRSGYDSCDNHGGIAQTAPESVDSWASCLYWCENTATDGLNTVHPLCQFNGGPGECWTIYPPGYESGVSNGDVNDCIWESMSMGVWSATNESACTSNDDWSNATVVSSTDVTYRGSNYGYTTETFRITPTPPILENTYFNASDGMTKTAWFK